MKLNEIAAKIYQINTLNTPNIPIFFKRKYSLNKTEYYFNKNNVLKEYTKDSNNSSYPMLHIFDFTDEWEFLNEDLNA